jgi:serine/threonine protein kinase
VSYHLLFQENILVDKSGCARLNDFGFTGIASLNCTETSAAGFRGSHRWMAPELISADREGESGLAMNASDVFALGMVTFEVSDVHRGRLPRGFETPSCTPFQIFTGQVPFPESKTSAVVMRKIIDGERPQRPSKGKNLGLSDEFWEIIRSSLAQEAKERPSVVTFVKFLEKATPDMAMIGELTEFDANSEDDVQRLRKLFGYGDNTLFGVREDEALVIIEVFDRVGSLVRPFVPASRF